MGGITVWRSIILFTGKRKRKKLVFFFSLSAVLIAGIVNYLLPPVKLPVTYTEISLLKYCKDLLPEKSFLIVNFNPALSSFFLGKEQKILPFSRELEYAGKVIALEKISSAASFREKCRKVPWIIPPH